MNFKIEARKQHEKLGHYARRRSVELSRLFREEELTAIAYERLLCRLTLILGTISPRNAHDRAIRDLQADAFDALYVARRVIFEAFSAPGFGLLRRAFESISLIHYFLIHPPKAADWTRGKQITNAQVRRALRDHPLGEDEESLKRAYAFYSGGTHPNRDYIPRRFLGEPNEFVLGSIGKPSLILIGEKLEHLLAHWFWLGALVSTRYLEITAAFDKGFGDAYMQAAQRNQAVAQLLRARLVDLIAREGTLDMPPEIQ
jgi:hypothetical protein